MAEPIPSPLTAWASLLTSIAAILNAIAWPAVGAWFVLTQRRRISELLMVFAHKLSAAKKVKFGQLELESELEAAVNDASTQVGDEPPPRTVPDTQLKAAVALKDKVRTTDLPREEVLDAVQRQIEDLATEYETVRAHMSSGPVRTRKMNEIAAGMRTLALAGLPLRTKLIASGSVGHRLAAICMLQVEPRVRYFSWLIDRIRIENQAFLLYQSAIAILELVRKKAYKNAEEIRTGIQEAIVSTRSFSGGIPDPGTLDVLNEALNRLNA